MSLKVLRNSCTVLYFFPLWLINLHIFLDLLTLKHHFNIPASCTLATGVLGLTNHNHFFAFCMNWLFKFYQSLLGFFVHHIVKHNTEHSVVGRRRGHRKSSCLALYETASATFKIKFLFLVAQQLYSLVCMFFFLFTKATDKLTN